eukprot:767487-Hanusia_phi.AAC.4
MDKPRAGGSECRKGKGEKERGGGTEAEEGSGGRRVGGTGAEGGRVVLVVVKVAGGRGGGGGGRREGGETEINYLAEGKVSLPPFPAPSLAALPLARMPCYLLREKRGGEARGREGSSRREGKGRKQQKRGEGKGREGCKGRRE